MASESPQDEIDIKTPAGSIRARGTDIIALLTLLAVCVILFFGYQQGIEARASKMEMASALQRFAQYQEELSYLISLTPEQRTKLNMDMPESLRKRLRDR